MNKRIIAVAVVAALAGIGYWQVSRPRPVKVTVVTVERGEVASSVTNTRAGTVNACRRAGISPTIGGQIAQLTVNEGDQVSAGDLLLELWNDDLQAQRTLAERQEAAAQSRAQEACVIAVVAKKEAQRLTRLLEQGLASEEAAEKMVGDADATAAGCQAARVSVQVSSAQIKVAEAALERTRLRAPFDGIIAEINGELGEFVTPSPVGIPTPPTVDLIDQSCLYISAPIDEVDAPAVRQNLPARISLDAFSDRTFSGRVSRVAPYVLDQEKQARTVEIEAVIDDPDKGNLLPGYSADVEVLLDSRDDVLRLPSSVILESSKVLILSETGTIEERSVETGLSNWAHTEILSGVTIGETVISSVDRAGVRPGALATAEQ